MRLTDGLERNDECFGRGSKLTLDLPEFMSLFFRGCSQTLPRLESLSILYALAQQCAAGSAQFFSEALPWDLLSEVPSHLPFD